jgi:hypothetical protein
MAGHAEELRPVQFRLPGWARDYVEGRASAKGESKTQVVIEAISCLRSREMEELMKEGYLAMRETARGVAEEGMAAGAETLPEW